MQCLNKKLMWLSKTSPGKYTMVQSNGIPGTMMLQRCRKCRLCRGLQKQDMATRLFHESIMHEKNAFVTWTYREPAPKELNRADFAELRDKLRDLFGIKMYCHLGEYGPKTHRPHGHSVIFGDDFLDTGYHLTDEQWTSPFLEELWGKGQVMLAPLNASRCAYAAGYVTGKIDDPDTFRLLPGKPGLGRSFLDKYWPEMAATGHCVIEGKVVPIPERYLRWMPEQFAKIKETHLELARNEAKHLEARREDKRHNRNRALNKNARDALKTYAI
jgi:hypothetical protein